MRRIFPILLVSLLLSIPALEDPASAQSPARSRSTIKKRECGTAPLGDREKEVIQREVDRRLGKTDATRTLRPPTQTIQVPVYFHVITSASGEGNVSRAINDQIDVLNDGFSGSGDSMAADTQFRFDLMGSDVTANDEWFFNCSSSQVETAMKFALYHGSPLAAQNPGVLHLYTCNADPYLGWAYYPSSVVGTDFYYYDGVVLHYQSVPGGAFVFADPNEPDGILDYNLGDTGTHEVGHWVGLYHTFEGGCGARGDLIEDTPSERTAAFYCTVRDSCKGRMHPGADPIQNFMDYTDDVCLTQFSQDQVTRSQAIWLAYRSTP